MTRIHWWYLRFVKHCTGAYDGRTIQHDAETCPVHEA